MMSLERLLQLQSTGRRGMPGDAEHMVGYLRVRLAHPALGALKLNLQVTGEWK
jgi:hypothetical protein